MTASEEIDLLDEISRKAGVLFGHGAYPYPAISRDRYVFEKARGQLKPTIEGMQADHSLMIAQHLWCKDKRYPCRAWKEMADRTKARYEKLEELIRG